MKKIVSAVIVAVFLAGCAPNVVYVPVDRPVNTAVSQGTAGVEIAHSVDFCLQKQTGMDISLKVADSSSVDCLRRQSLDNHACLVMISSMQSVVHDQEYIDCLKTKVLNPLSDTSRRLLNTLERVNARMKQINFTKKTQA